MPLGVGVMRNSPLAILGVYLKRLLGSKMWGIVEALCPACLQWLKSVKRRSKMASLSLWLQGVITVLKWTLEADPSAHVSIYNQIFKHRLRYLSLGRALSTESEAFGAIQDQGQGGHYSSAAQSHGHVHSGYLVKAWWNVLFGLIEAKDILSASN